MENASKALLMTASILIGLIILSLGIYLVNTFRSFSQDYNDSMEIQRMEQFNAQFTAFSARSNVSIHEIITLVNYAKEFNDTNDLKSGESQFINVKVKINNKMFNLTNKDDYPKTEYSSYDLFINALLDGTYIYENVKGVKDQGQYQYDYNETTKKKTYYNCYKCTPSSYEVNPKTGRVESITFEFEKNYTE